MPRQRFRRETGRGARDEHGFTGIKSQLLGSLPLEKCILYNVHILHHHMYIYIYYIYIYVYVLSPRCLPFSSDQFSMDSTGWQPWVSPLLAPRWAMSKLVQQPATTRVAKLLLRAAVEGNFHLNLIIPCNYTIFIFPYISNRNEVIWLPKSFRLRWRSTTPPSTASRHWAACITYKNTPFNTKESPTMWLNWTQWK